MSISCKCCNRDRSFDHTGRVLAFLGFVLIIIYPTLPYVHLAIRSLVCPTKLTLAVTAYPLSVNPGRYNSAVDLFTHYCTQA